MREEVNSPKKEKNEKSSCKNAERIPDEDHTRSNKSTMAGI